MAKRGMLLTISGPTGAKKDKVIQALLEKDENLVLSKSFTTREKREDEVDEYEYIDKKEFLKRVQQGFFLEWAEIYDNYYGTPKHQVEKLLKQGKNVIAKVDIKGALQIKEKVEDAILIFILPPSIEELKETILNSDKVETPEMLIRKFNSAYPEINSISKYNYGVVNDNVDAAVEKIEKIISAEECRVDRIKDELSYIIG